jgi:hypothetical protein
MSECINCGGPHNASSLSCPELTRQKNIKNTMATESMSYKDAAARHPLPKKSFAQKVTSNPQNYSYNTTIYKHKNISQKKHENPSAENHNHLLSYSNGQATNPTIGCALNNSIPKDSLDTQCVQSLINNIIQLLFQSLSQPLSLPSIVASLSSVLTSHNILQDGSQSRQSS